MRHISSANSLTSHSIYYVYNKDGESQTCDNRVCKHKKQWTFMLLAWYMHTQKSKSKIFHINEILCISSFLFHVMHFGIQERKHKLLYTKTTTLHYILIISNVSKLIISGYWYESCIHNFFILLFTHSTNNFTQQ